MGAEVWPGAGNVIGPGSAVSGNLASFNGTSGQSLADSGIAATSVATSQTVANSTARLALTGLARGARVFQDDTDFWYELINPAAPSDAASWQGIPKVYKATLTQTSTNAPVATVLENSLGGTVVWARSAQGTYTATLASVFTANKTFMNITATENGVGDWGVVNVLRTSTSVITVTTTAVSFPDPPGDLQDECLVEAGIEILVYPS